MITGWNASRLFPSLGLAAAIATGVLASASVANAQAGFAILHTFIGGGTDGISPYAGLIQGPDGTLYGTTGGGGTGVCTGGCGTVFQLAPDGSGFTILHSFTGYPTDGTAPRAGLIQGPDGTLYGTTYRGGTSNLGTVFQLAPDGSGFTVLHSFTAGTGGANPLAGLIQGSDGTLYGTTLTGGGGPLNAGTVFRLAPDGSGFTILHNFTGGATDGQSPWAGVIQGPDGTLYGTTLTGGTGGIGTVFRVAPDGSGFTVLHSFPDYPTDGTAPRAGLIQGPDGTLYGTTQFAGTNDAGTVFQLAPDGSGYTVLYTFAGYPTDGAGPFAGLIQGPDGTLYGTTPNGGTNNGGTVFQLAPDGSGYTVLHSFTGGTGGAYPYAGLIQASDGTLYGTTLGSGVDAGVVFQLTLSPSVTKRR